MLLKRCSVIVVMVNPMTSIKTYSELITLPTFEERYEYLRLGGKIGVETFGFDRYLNQMFYQSSEWDDVRNEVIIRDCGCDLAVLDREISGRILVHHINPITIEDIIHRSKFLFDPEYLISTSRNTHNAIHYGDSSLLIKDPIERTLNDTCPWKK